jgi:DNA-binding HxlR family transcriptional regulator
MRVQAATSHPCSAHVEPISRLSEKVRRGDLLWVDCPSREVLRHLTSRWVVLVLIVLEGARCASAPSVARSAA